MIDQAEAEKALEFLRVSAEKVGPLTKQARLKAHMLKYVEALLVKSQHNQGTPVSIAKEYARADDRYLAALQEDAEAAAELIGLNERRDTAKITISLTQSLLRDRL